MKKIVLGVLLGLISFALIGDNFVFAKAPSHKPFISRSKDGITLSFSQKTHKVKEKVQVPVDIKNPFVLKNSGNNINLLTGKKVEQKYKTETLTTETILVTTTVKNSKKQSRDLRILFRHKSGGVAQWDVTIDPKGLIKKGKDTYVMEQGVFNNITEIEIYELSAFDGSYV